MTIKRFFVLALLFSMATGCSTFPVENMSKLDPSKKITVFSYVGDNMLITNTGPSSADNWQRMVDVKTWGTNDYIENKIFEMVAENGRFKFSRSDTGKYRSQIKQIKGKGLNDEIEIIGAPSTLKKLANVSNADLILIVISIATNKFNDNKDYGLKYQQQSNPINTVSLKFIIYDPNNNKSIAQMLTHSTKVHNSFSRFSEHSLISKYVLGSYREIYFPMLDEQIKQALEKTTIIKQTKE